MGILLTHYARSHTKFLTVPLAEQPDCLGVRHPVAKAQSQKPHEGKPVGNDKFGLIVGQAIQRLQHQNFEQQNRCLGRTPALGSIRALQSLRQRLVKYTPANDRIQLLQRLARSAQPLIPLVQIPKQIES
jgi:hypothetical protein